MSEIPTAAKYDAHTLRLVASDVSVEVDAEYEAETLPLSPEAGQRVESLDRQSAAPQSLEDSAS